jgi:hypothetical protein
MNVGKVLGCHLLESLLLGPLRSHRACSLSLDTCSMQLAWRFPTAPPTHPPSQTLISGSGEVFNLH